MPYLPYELDFNRPAFLYLLLLLPVLWWVSFRSLAGLGRIRRVVALGLRTAVLTGLVMALAEAQLVKSDERLTVIYLLDLSRSIPAEHRAKMVEYVNASVEKHRPREDRAGVIVFGKEALIEVPPFDDNLPLTGQFESQLDPDHTNLEGALTLAQATFREDTAKRVVIVTDGNENIGDILDQARKAVGDGISIDVRPVIYGSRTEAMVEKVTIPPDIRKGDPFRLRVVLNNISEPTAEDPGIVKGKLSIYRRTNDQPDLISEENIELAPGKRVFSVGPLKIENPDFYTYEARFTADDPARDAMVENNRATTFTHVRGSGQVLLIEDATDQGQFNELVDRLRKENLEVTVQPSNQLFTTLPELQRFDSVILANVPREEFSDAQIEMLAQNTQAMGSGLMMLGGPNSFGAGGWSNTEIEKALPLDFTIKSAKVVPKGALALIMHASEMPEGNYWQKVIAKEAIKALGSEDYAGLLNYSGSGTDWLWGGITKVGQRRDRMLGLIDRMQPGDMPDFDPGLVMAERGFAKLTDAAAKHMIVISDGDPSPPSASILRKLKANNISVTSVAVGCHGPADSGVMKRLAADTGGKYYAVNDPRALPRIFQREARRVARPLVYENENGFQPTLDFPHEMTSGIQGPLPPITGFVMTTAKQNPLVEISMSSPEPSGEERRAVLASWTYGLGKTVAFTTDTGARWAKNWPGWANYDKLVSQMVRWSMRPVGEAGKFSVSTDVVDGQVRVLVTGLDQDDQFLNFLSVSGNVVGPDMKPRAVKLSQTAPGRYVGAFDATDAGSYFISLTPGAGKAPLLAGVNVPYSAEFRDREANQALLEQLARLAPNGANPGQLIVDSTGQDSLTELLKTDSFRHDLPRAKSSQDVWPSFLFIAACIFFGDVFVRRVTVRWDWVPPLAARVRNRLLGREPPPPPTEFMERLRSRKAEVSGQLEQRRAQARFEPVSDRAADESLLDLDPSRERSAGPGQHSEALAPDEAQEQNDYTSRLLKAKQKVWKERGGPQG